VLGWYAAGSAATVASWAVLAALTWVTSPEVIVLIARLGFVAGIVALVVYGRRLPRRSRIALWLGAATPLVLAAAAVADVLYSLAHSNSFTF
jgi:hypothetical protein